VYRDREKYQQQCVSCQAVPENPEKPEGWYVPDKTLRETLRTTVGLTESEKKEKYYSLATRSSQNDVACFVRDALGNELGKGPP
jgi:hypothetical protein